MPLDMRQFRHLAAVAKLGSFSKAAQRLRISQPALSRSIAAFEAEAGFKLFDRTPQGVVPTAFAIPLIHDIEAILGQAERLETNIREKASGASGSIAFGVGPMIAPCLVPELLSHVAKQGPSVKVEAVVDAASALLSLLTREEIEFLIAARNLVPNTSELQVHPLARVRIGFVVRRGHPLAGKGVVEPEDLASFPIATGSTSDGTPFHGMAGTPVPAATMICENFSLLEQIVVQSDTIWITSPDLLRSESADKVTPLNLRGWEKNVVDLVLVSKQQRTLSPIAQVLIPIITSLLAEFAGTVHLRA